MTLTPLYLIIERHRGAMGLEWLKKITFGQRFSISRHIST